MPKQRAKIVQMYIENNKSIVLTQHAHRRQYLRQNVPKKDKFS